MELEFSGAKWSMDAGGAWLSLRVPSPKIATRWLDQMQEGKTYTAKLSEKRERRSMDANAYYWCLCGKLSAALDLEPETVYRQHIRGLGNYAVYGMTEEAVPLFTTLWTSNHLGRMVETRAAKQPGIVNVLAYYGSSDFDRAQMARLIDHCIQDCKAVGIETKSPEELESLLSGWQ